MRKFIFVLAVLCVAAGPALANGYGVSRVRVMATVNVGDCGQSAVVPTYAPPAAAPVCAPAQLDYAPAAAFVPVAAPQVYYAPRVFAAPAPVYRSAAFAVPSYGASFQASTTVVKHRGLFGRLFAPRTVIRSRTVVR